MKFLIDTTTHKLKVKMSSALVRGQLITPLTRRKNWGGEFAVDNGAFSGFNARRYSSLLARQPKEKCLFVVVPDIVGDGRRTLELWKHRERWEWSSKFPLAFVAQDGMEDLEIPWSEMDAIFIGGKDPWKDSQSAADIVRTAKALGMLVHIGRVNTNRRFSHFAELSSDTCDGSGVAMYDHMLEKIERHINREPDPTLFDGADE